MSALDDRVLVELAGRGFGVGSDKLLRRDKHRSAASAREMVDWLTWLELGGASRATLDSYERTAADLLDDNPTVAFAKFTDSHLLKRLMKYPPASRRVRKAHLASWFKWGYRTRRIPANPVDLLPKINQPAQKVIDVFSPAEEEALCSLPSPDGHLMTLLFNTGLRKAEAIHLRARRLNFETGLLIVREGAKGSKERVVPMRPRLAKAMANMILLEGINPDDYLWYDKPGGAFAIRVRRSKPIVESAFHRWWKRCIDQADVTYRKPHTTRHTFATRWRERGLAIDEIQQLLGHASVSTTSDLYVHTGISQIGARMHHLLGGDED